MWLAITTVVDTIGPILGWALVVIAGLVMVGNAVAVVFVVWVKCYDWLTGEELRREELRLAQREVERARERNAAAQARARERQAQAEMESELLRAADIERARVMRAGLEHDWNVMRVETIFGEWEYVHITGGPDRPKPEPAGVKDPPTSRRIAL